MKGALSFMVTTRRAVIRRWAKGHDTWMIGRHYGIAEADVCRIISAEQDRRHRNRVVAARHRARLASLGLDTSPPTA